MSNMSGIRFVRTYSENVSSYSNALIIENQGGYVSRRFSPVLLSLLNSEQAIGGCGNLPFIHKVARPLTGKSRRFSHLKTSACLLSGLVHDFI